jgi:beta-lactam-binding protein with PASTA domain
MKLDLAKYNKHTLGGVFIHAFIAFCILVILGLAYFYTYLPSVTNHGESVTVPNIEGMPIDQVEDFLAKHDLRFEVNDSSYSSKYPPLTILKQFPAAGAQVKENRKVYVSINRVNPPSVPMPDILNTSLINAEAVLKGSELKRGKIHLVKGPFLNLVQEIKVGGNTVVPGARVPKGTVVDLVIMDGGSMSLPAPNVMRMPYEEANANIRGMDLNVNVTLLGDTTGLSPIVLKQKPVASTPMRVGDIIELWVGAPDAEVPPDENQPDDQNDGN